VTPQVSAPPPQNLGPRKIALLVPLTGPSAALGHALEQAAKLALTGKDAPILDVRDTGGDPRRAGEQALAASQNGDALMIGPLTAAETTLAASNANGVPILAFTSDPGAAAPGVWTLGLTPTQQVKRLAAALKQDNRPRLAAVLPPGVLGDALAQAASEATAEAGLPPPVIRREDDGPDGFGTALRDLADVDARHQAVAARVEAVGGAGDAEARNAATEAAAEPPAPPNFDALLIAETGDQLDAALTPLAGDDITLPNVRLLGPAFWAGRGGTVPHLQGAWYAAPDPAPHHVFAAAFAAKYGVPPPPLASLGFDAAAIAAVLAHEGDMSLAALTRGEGFAGADGAMRLLPDGHVARALAVFEVSAAGDKIISPAPDSAGISASGP
jgi:ABC-type branched-subunit amino acid transport system substrate-binding protein